MFFVYHKLSTVLPFIVNELHANRAREIKKPNLCNQFFSSFVCLFFTRFCNYWRAVNGSVKCFCWASWNKRPMQVKRVASANDTDTDTDWEQRSWLLLSSITYFLLRLINAICAYCYTLGIPSAYTDECFYWFLEFVKVCVCGIFLFLLFSLLRFCHRRKTGSRRSKALHISTDENDEDDKFNIHVFIKYQQQ